MSYLWKYNHRSMIYEIIFSETYTETDRQISGWVHSGVNQVYPLHFIVGVWIFNLYADYKKQHCIIFLLTFQLDSVWLSLSLILYLAKCQIGHAMRLSVGLMSESIGFKWEASWMTAQELVQTFCKWHRYRKQVSINQGFPAKRALSAIRKHGV